MSQTASIGFATDMQRYKRAPKKSFEERVEIAKRRFKAALARKGGAINVRSEGDMVEFGIKNVFNRDRELGDHKTGEFRKVIVRVVKDLLRTVCKHDAERGLLVLHEPFTQRRVHVSKQPPFRKVRTPRRFRAA